jgi:hypothetical protein
MRHATLSRSRRRAPLLPLSGVALALFAASVATQSACIKRGYPLAQAGQVDIRSDIAGALFAASSFDKNGKPLEPRQTPFETGVKLYMTEGSEAAFGGTVEVRIEPPEALSLEPSASEPADDKSCELR